MKIKKITEQQWNLIKKNINFYNFETQDILFGHTFVLKIKLPFLEKLTHNTYKKINWCSNLFFRIIVDIIHLTDCDYILLHKYSKKWIVNKKIQRNLNKTLKVNNIKNISNSNIIIDICDVDLLIKFMQSILMYNSFVNFIINNKKIIITVTDHFDIFLFFDNDSITSDIQSVVNIYSKYIIAEENYFEQ